MLALNEPQVWMIIGVFAAAMATMVTLVIMTIGAKLDAFGTKLDAVGRRLDALERDMTAVMRRLFGIDRE